MPIYDKEFLLTEAQAMGNAGDEYTSDVDGIDLGYAAPVPNISRGGKFGLHVVVTTAHTGLNSGAEIWICSGGSTTPTTKVSGRFLALRAVVAGTHYFIPCAPTLARYIRALFHPVSENATAGAVTMWLGPDEDGAI